MSVLEICEWIETTPIGVLVRESLWGFQVFVAIHILGLAVSVGTVVWFDFRLLGVSMRRVPVSTVYRHLMPCAIGGFLIMFVSGGGLFSGFATAAYGNTYFRIKAFAIVLAGANALTYHLVTERRLTVWNEAVRPPLPARLAGLISIVLWAVVLLSGRMMSYTMF